MSYSRDNPSPNYRRMVDLYRELHNQGEHRLGQPPAATFPGVSLFPHIGRVKALIERTGARTVLDYGCGKGYQYEPQKISVPGEGEWEGVIEYWDIDEVRCYDPAYDCYSQLPQGKFDGVISTDVLEHCLEDDVPWIVDEMFSYANRFVFACVACFPALATLPNGENAHCTVRPFSWWREIFAAAGNDHPQILWELFEAQREHHEHGSS